MRIRVPVGNASAGQGMACHDGATRRDAKERESDVAGAGGAQPEVGGR
jgi:hypothetical protein